MRRKHFTEEQIAFALRQVDHGTKMVEVCRKMGMSEQAFYRWKKKHSGTGPGELRLLKQLFANPNVCSRSKLGLSNATGVTKIKTWCLGVVSKYVVHTFQS